MDNRQTPWQSDAVPVNSRLLIVLDLEGTLTGNEFWDGFENAKGITTGAMVGEADFRASMHARLKATGEVGVEEFQEVDEPDGWKAVLALTVTLLDVSQEELPRRVVFQKQYRAVEPMPDKTPKGLAQGMSKALEHLSARIITDTYEATRQRAARK